MKKFLYKIFTLTLFSFLIINCTLIIKNCEAQWLPDVRLTNTTTHSSTSPNNARCIASNWNDVHVVWIDQRESWVDKIYYKRSTDGGISWGSDTRLSNCSQPNSPSIALSGSVVHVVWKAYSDGKYKIYHKFSTDGGITWGEDTQLTNSTGSFGSYFSSLSVSGQTIHIVFCDDRDYAYNPEIYYKRSTDGGVSWGADTRLTNAPYSSASPSISASGSSVHVAWCDQRIPSNYFDIFYKHSTDGGISWGSDIQLTNNSFQSESYPSISASGSVVHVVWEDERVGNYNKEIYYKRSTDGGVSWGVDTRLTNAPQYSINSSLTTSGSSVHVVWQDQRNSKNDIYYKRSTDRGVNWESDTRLTDNSLESWRPSVSVSGSMVHVVWTCQPEDKDQIYYKHNPTGNPPPPPDNNIPISLTPEPIPLPNSGATIQFSTLGSNNVNPTVTIQKIIGSPGTPSHAGTPAPVYLQITATNLANYTFSCEIILDVDGINGFNPNTKVMYFSSASNSWVGIDGVYSPSAKTFTFTTDHFTPFGFVNPTNPNDIYLSQLTTDPVNTQKWYPAVGMGTFGIPSPDWDYVNAKATYYVVPTGTTGMFSSKFAVVWDKSKADLTVEAGDYYSTQLFYAVDSTSGNNGRYWVNVASTDLTNQVPGGGKYIAKLDFTNIKPGYIPVSIDGTDFRYFANDEQQGVYVTTHPGKILFYLGDVGSGTTSLIETLGDGKINGKDLSLFSSAYWSILGTHPSYKYKYDIGPTNANGSYWALPTPDGRIEFEDLNIFAIGYGKTGAGQLPDNPGENKMNISTLAMKYENGYFKVPVKVSGVVNDFRTGSFEFGYSSGELEYVGFEKKGGFEGDDNFMLSKTENNKIMLDAAIVGAEKTGMNGEQIIMNLLFTEKQSGSHNVNVLTARARNSGNTPIDISFDGSNGASSEIPTTFTLNQNYPNPFNPGTTIKYGLPKDAKVSLVVFDILGRKVMTLVNDNQKAGYHEVQFNALNLASGTYFYRIIAGDFTSIKRMVLLK